MLYRAAFRRLVVEELIRAQTVAGTRVYPSRALPVGLEILPAILVQTPRERKVSQARGAPKFTSVGHLEVVGIVEARVYQEAESAIEDLVEQIELAVLANRRTVNAVQQFPSVETEIAINAQGKSVVGQATMLFEFEYPQFYDPPATTPLANVEIDMTVVGSQASQTLKFAVPT